jgi:F-type H+-transporting ATPase subunit epsilon
MQLEIITPEVKVFTGEVEAVQLPGLDGLFQVLNGHTPIVSALKEGTIKVDLKAPFEVTEKTSDLIEKDSKDSKVIRLNIKGGVAELMNNKMIVLAE